MFHGGATSDWGYTAAVYPMDANLLIAASVREPKYCSDFVTGYLRQLVP
jgi:hypothetical protein